MVWMEDNICIYRYGEILHTSAVLVGTIHVIQGIYINWREPAFSSVVCKQKVCLTTRRRMVKEMQVVGGPNSTKEKSTRGQPPIKKQQSKNLRMYNITMSVRILIMITKRLMRHAMGLRKPSGRN